MKLFGLFKKKENPAHEGFERERLEEEVAQAEKQADMGDQLFATIKMAASQNAKVCESWQLKVGRLPNNAGAYSVTLYLVEPHWKGCMMQFDVKPDKLYSLYGPYGPKEEFVFEDFHIMLEKAHQKVCNFR